MDEFDVADWYAMVEKAVDWLLAHPGMSALHALDVIAETPAELTFIAAVEASASERMAFHLAVHRAVGVHRRTPDRPRRSA